MKKTILYPCVMMLVILTGCKGEPALQSIDSMAEGQEKSSRYVLSDQYAQHRQQQQFVKTSEGNVAYLVYGQGPVIVMLHGVPTSSWLFRKMIEPLQHDYRIIAVDLLGFGSSDKPESNGINYRPSSQAKYVKQVLSHLQIENYNLLFHDMGGLVAWELLVKDLSNDSASKVDNLLILNTIVTKQGFNYPTQKGIAARVMSDAFANDLSSAAVLNLTFNNMGLSSNAQLSEDECFGYVAPMKEGNGDVLFDFYTGFDDAFFNKLDEQVSSLSSFDGDVLVLWGAEDSVLTTTQIPILQESVHVLDKNIHIFEDNAHFLPEEIPLILNEKIRQFLSN